WQQQDEPFLISRAGMAHERAAADNGGHDGKADCPCRDCAPGDKIAFGGLLITGGVETDRRYYDEVYNDDGKIEGMHGAGVDEQGSTPTKRQDQSSRESCTDT